MSPNARKLISIREAAESSIKQLLRAIIIGQRMKGRQYALDVN